LKELQIVLIRVIWR